MYVNPCTLSVVVSVCLEHCKCSSFTVALSGSEQPLPSATEATIIKSDKRTIRTHAHHAKFEPIVRSQTSALYIRSMVAVICRYCRSRLNPFLVRTMAAFSVYVTRPDVPEIAFDIFKRKGYKVSGWTEERPVPRDVLLNEIAQKDALFCMLTDKIDVEVLNKAGPSLKVIGTMSVGFEHLDLEEIAKRNIKVGYTPGVLTAAVAELTLGLLLATSRRLFESHQTILDGTWPSWSPSWMCGVGLNNSVVGIVGFGRIGQEVAKLLQPFGISQIYYTARSDKPEAEKLNAKRTDLDTLLKISDFIIVTCALTPETKGMFNKSTFSKMKPTSIFINTSRGGVVEQDDLIEALEKGQIGAAGLDVMTPEPLPKDHPLLKLKNCVVIPHIGSASIEARHNMAQLTANNIVAALENRPMETPLILNKSS